MLAFKKILILVCMIFLPLTVYASEENESFQTEYYNEAEEIAESPGEFDDTVISELPESPGESETEQWESEEIENVNTETEDTEQQDETEETQEAEVIESEESPISESETESSSNTGSNTETPKNQTDTPIILLPTQPTLSTDESDIIILPYEELAMYFESISKNMDYITSEFELDIETNPNNLSSFQILAMNLASIEQTLTVIKDNIVPVAKESETINEEQAENTESQTEFEAEITEQEETESAEETISTIEILISHHQELTAKIDLLYEFMRTSLMIVLICIIGKFLYGLLR